MSYDSLLKQDGTVTIEVTRSKEAYEEGQKNQQRDLGPGPTETGKNATAVQMQPRTTPGVINFNANREDARSLLLDDSKKDSPEMIDVKEAVSLLETMLTGRYDGPDSITRIKKQYEEAISACRTYCTKKNSRRSVGMKRKAMVELVKNNMIMEYSMITILEKRCKDSGTFPQAGGSCTNLLDVTKTNLSVDDEAKVLLSGKQVQFDNLLRGNGDEDSPEMKEVKRANKELFNLLYNTRVMQGEADHLADMVKVEFASVISACSEYIKAKSSNPKSADGKERLAAIKELRDRYKKETRHISGAISALRKKGEDVSLAVAYMRINSNKLMFTGEVFAEEEVKTTATATTKEVKTQTKAKKKKEDDFDLDKEMKQTYINEIYGPMMQELRGYRVPLNFEKDKLLTDRKIKEGFQLKEKTAAKEGIVLQPMTDAQVYGAFFEVDMDDPGYLQHITDLRIDLNKNYRISVQAQKAVEILYKMLVLQKKCREAQSLLPQLDARIEQLTREAATYKVPVPDDWVQDENQHYPCSCWAVSSMNLVNCFNARHNPGKARVKQRFVLKKDGQNPVKYNDTLKRNANGTDLDFYFEEEKANIEGFLTNPVHMGNVRTVADRLMETTDHKSIVMSKRFNVLVDPGLPKEVYDKRCELLKLEMLKSIHETLTVTKSPISVLRGGHYLTIVGIDGRKLICKNSAASTPANYNDTMTIDQLFSANQTNRTVEFVWLRELTQEALDEIKQEFPKAKETYETRKQDRLEPGGYFEAADYTHVDGCDITKRELDEIHGSNEIQTVAYVPKQLPQGLAM